MHCLRPDLLAILLICVDKATMEILPMKFLRSELFTNILYIIGAAIVAGFFTFLMRQTIINVSRYIEFDLKNEVFQQYRKLSLSFYKAKPNR